MGYTFYKQNGSGHITSTSGEMWGCSSGANIKFIPHDNMFKIDFNTETLSFSMEEIDFISEIAVATIDPATGKRTVSFTPKYILETIQSIFAV